jgi:uncharacterized protein YutE (UPF0331/DUF86 family)
MVSLRDKVEAEKESIFQALADLQQALDRTERSVVELAAIALFVHNFYNGVENILKLIVKAKGLSVPSSTTWHKDLLELSVSQQIMSRNLADELYAYLTFRHFLVHAYAFRLDENQLMPLANHMGDICARFISQIDSVVEAMEPSS